MNSNIKIVGDLSRVNEEERAFINRHLEKFIERHGAQFSEMHLSVDFGIHKETSRGRAAHYVKLNLDTDRGRYHAENQDFGAEKTLHGAINKVERQLQKSLA